MASSLRALIVSDHREALPYPSTTLSAAGWDLAAASTMERASRLMRDGQYDLVFLDLPRLADASLNGVHQLVRRSPQTTYLLRSGANGSELGVACLAVGAGAILYKPFSLRDLQVLICRLARSDRQNLPELYRAYLLSNFLE